jgi:hypothetical protein
MTYIILTVLGLALLGFGFYKYKQSQTEKTGVEPTESEQPAPELDRTDIMLNDLLNVNILIRENISNEDVIQKAEEVIDLTRELIVPMNTEPNIGEMTPVVNRMTVYLGKILDPYMKMSTDRREATEEIATDKLDKLVKTLTTVKTALNNKDNAEFDKQAEFITAMFPEAEDTL